MIACGARIWLSWIRAMLFVPSFSDLDELNGVWSRDELERMDAAFVRALSRAFASGHESPVAARATVRLGRNGSKVLAEDAAIQVGWSYLRTNMAAGVDVSAVEVLARVRASCPGVAAEQVRVAFKKRFKGFVVTG